LQIPSDRRFATFLLRKVLWIAGRERGPILSFPQVFIAKLAKVGCFDAVL